MFVLVTENQEYLRSRKSNVFSYLYFIVLWRLVSYKCLDTFVSAVSTILYFGILCDTKVDRKYIGYLSI